MRSTPPDPRRRLPGSLQRLWATTADAQPLTRLGGRDELEAYSGRFRLMFLLFVLPFVALTVRLWQLQVLEQDEFDRRAQNNLVRTVELPADRGLIFDARGREVAKNRPSYDVFITPRLFKRRDDALPTLRDALNLTPDDVESIQAKLSRASGQAFIARRDITRDQVAWIETHRDAMPGVEVRVQSHRYYPYNTLAAHLIGFMNEIRSKELEEREEFGYKPGDYIGRMGLERGFEAVLRGSPGLERQIVDARGLPQGEEDAEALLGRYRRVDPIPGRNLHLTIDMQLQQLLAEEFAPHAAGAAVAIDPRDGSVLALMSKPFFNPNSWTGRLSQEEKRRVDNDPFKPMLDKTVQAHFPGSTFKLVTAAAALNEGWIQPDETINCPGFYMYGGRAFRCWNRVGHGQMDLADSLKHSCDVYYYKVAEKLGMDTLARYAYMFGFGERAGLGLNGEQRGLVPTKDWCRKYHPDGFQYGMTLSTAVGQFESRVTPLQLALSYSALANGGKLYYPRIIDRIESAGGRVLYEYPARVRSTLNLPKNILDQIDTGMSAVVNERNGTAFKHKLDYINVGGKTGTAQVKNLDSLRFVDGQITLRDRDHAWFVAYAPIENPEIVLTVFIEHGGSGGAVAAPLALKIVDRYFKEVRDLDPEAEKRRLVQHQRRGPRRIYRDRAPRRNTVWAGNTPDPRPGEPDAERPQARPIAAPAIGPEGNLFGNLDDAPDRRLEDAPRPGPAPPRAPAVDR